MVRLGIFAAGVFGAVQVAAFSFVFTAPIQCSNLTVTWAGGTGPYHLLITPVYSTPQNITIPDNAYNGTYGSYTTPLRVTGKQNQRRFLLTMSDATGFGSGGTSGLLTAGADSNSGSCDVTDPGTDFNFSLDAALQQCRPYTWSYYSAAVQPVTIYGLIPLGKAFVLNPPQGDSYTWNTNVASGTNVVFVMVDSQGRQGGSTDFYTVGASDDSSCITSDSPSSTAQSTAATTPTSSSTPSSTGSSSNAAVIGGSIAGGAVLLLALASLTWFFIQRKHRRSRDEEDSSSAQGINHKRQGRSVDLLPDDRSGQSVQRAQYPLPSPGTGDPLHTHELDAHGRSVYDPDPYVLPPPSEAEGYFPRASENQEEGGSTPRRHTRGLSAGTTLTSGMTKAQMAAAASGSVRSQGTRRFVLHTDAGEVDDDDVVELPPMYTQVRPRQDARPSDGGPTSAPHIDDPLRS